MQVSWSGNRLKILIKFISNLLSMVLLYKRLNQKLSPELIIAKVKPRTYNCVNFLLDKG